MKGLYLGRYLIAIYDHNDNLVDVVDSPSGLKMFKNEGHARSYVSRVFHGRIKHSQIHFIDVLEKNEDIFKEEDEIFIKQYKTKETNKDKAKKLGIGLRTYLAKKCKFK